MGSADINHPSILQGEDLHLPFVPTNRRIEAAIKSQQNGQPVTEKTALIFGDRKTKFGELNRASNRIARLILQKLKNKGQLPQANKYHVMCAFVSTSDTHVFTWLAIAKTGVGIMALTAMSSIERSQMICKQNPPVCFLVDRDLDEVFQNKKLHTDIPTFYIQDLMKESVENKISEEDLDDSEMLQVPEADFTFFQATTSGTTGVPKIVPITHTEAYNALYWYMERNPQAEDDIYLTHAVLLTDYTETIASLIKLRTQVILTEDQHKDPQFVCQTINKFKITRVYFFSPSFLANLMLILKMENNKNNCKTLRSVVSISETMPQSLLEDFFYYFSNGVTLYNGFGMCETADEILTVECFNDASDIKDGVYDGKVSIGKPLHNTNVYVLDDALEPAAPGKMGNLWLSGASVFKGYLNSQTPTLVPNKFTQKPGHEKMFNTGDLARIINGRIIYEGRSIHHVKIRGFRLHTGEVATCITKHLPGVLSAVVMGLESSGYQVELVAFYTVKPGHTVSGDDVIGACKDHLEEYKVPVATHLLETIPIKQPNDKIDAQKLKDIHYEQTRQRITCQKTANRDLDPVTDALFTAVAGAFKLPKDALSEDLNIFDIGGNSINIVWIWSKLKENGYDVTINDILACRTLKDILVHMRNESQHEQQKEDERYMVVNLFDQADAVDALHTIALDFVKRNDVVKSIGIDYETYYNVLIELWDSFKKCDFSQAVRDRETGKYLAVTLYMLEPVEQELDLETIVGRYPLVTPLALLLDKMDKPVKDLMRTLPGKNAYAWFLGVDQELGLQETMRVMKLLDEADIARARKEGIRRFSGVAMHPVTKATGEDAGWLTVYETRANQICHDGQKMFPDVDDNFIMASQVLGLEDKNEPYIIRDALKKHYANTEQ